MPASLRPDVIQGKLNETRPQGLRITRCENGLSRSGEPSDRRETFEIRLRGETFDTQCLGAFDAAEKMILGELVVYPDKSLPWDKSLTWDKDTQLAAFGTPRWFDTWAEAVGLPVQKL